MSGPNAPVSVRVSDGSTDRHVTGYVSGLRWTKMVNAGHQSCSFRMTLPRGTFSDLGPEDRVWVYDDRTGRCLFDGYLENPTPTDGPDGEVYDVSALGGVALANDQSEPLIYLDTRTDQWVKSDNSTTSGTVEDVDVVGQPARRVGFPGGNVVANGAVIAADYRAIRDARMKVGGLRVFSGSGRDDTDYRLDLYAGPDDGSGSLFVVGSSSGIQTTGVDESFFTGDTYTLSGGGTGAMADADRVAIQLRRTGGATNVAVDDVYADLVHLSVLGQRYDRHGTLLTGSADLGPASSVYAHQVVEDLLGRLLTFCDPWTAVVDATTFAIDQLAFPDGVKAADVLSALSRWEPDCWWAIGAAGPNGLHEFTYQRWATEPRYVISVKDGYRETGSDVDLCNRVLVSWTDSKGTAQTTIVTAADLVADGSILPTAVDALGSRVKDAEPLTLPDGFGSEANAVQIGKASLLDKINPPRAARAVVSRPIVDRLTGCTVMPWELEPGWPVMVRERGHISRCTQVDYDDDPVAASLTLGTPPLTSEQRQARLARAA